MPGSNGPAIRMDVERHEEVVVVRPHGRITQLESQTLSDEMMARLEEGVHHLILDLGDVPFLTSSCLGAIMAAHKRAREIGASILIAETQPLVRDILAATKLTKLFPLFDSVEEALAAP